MTRTKFCRAVLVPVALLAMVTISGPISAQSGGEAPAPQISAPAVPAQFGTPYDIGPSPSLRFTLDRAVYALGWTDHVRATGGVAGCDEKMLVLFFTIENAGTTDLRLRHNTLKFQAIDEQGLVHERSGAMEVRTAKLTVAAEPAARNADNTTLRPGEPLQLYTAILVPKRVRIPRLAVGTTRDGNNEVIYMLDGRVDPLPDAYHDTHPEIVREEIEAGPGQFLAAPSFDIQVDGIETTTDPAQVGRRPGAPQTWALVRMTVRNRSQGPQNFSAGSFKETRIVDTGGELHPPGVVLHESRAERVRPKIEPGATGSFRVAFRLTEGAMPEALRLQVTGDGKLSHRYRVPFGGGPRLSAQLGAPVAPGVLYVGRYGLVAAAPVQPLPGIVMPQESPLPPVVIQPTSPVGVVDGAEEEAETPPAAMANLSVASITLDTLEGWSVAESGGDEPHLMVWSFQAQLRPGGYRVRLLESRMVLLGPNDWLDVGRVPYQPSSQSFRQNFPYSFYNLEPYDVYGIVVSLIEFDSSDHSDRVEYGQRLASAMAARLLQQVEASPPIDVNDASERTQRAYLARVQQAMAELGQVNAANLFDATAGSGWGDTDDYLGTRIYAGVHLPAVAWPAQGSSPVMSPNSTVLALHQAGSNMGLTFMYELLWRHSVQP